MKSVVNKFLIPVYFFTLSAFSQNNFGAFAGVNYSYFTNGFFNKAGIERTPGLQIGALYNIILNNTISFRPKIAFSQQGDRFISDYNSNSYVTINDINYKLSYINVPLDFKIGNKIYVIAGPQAGILLSTKKESRDYGPLSSSLDFGVNLGVGFTISNLFFEAGLYQGFTKLLAFRDGGGDKLDLSNGAIKITAGYNFK